MCTRYRLLRSLIVTGTIIASGVLIASAEAENHFEHLRAKAKTGSVKDQIELARAYMFGRGIARDEKLAAEWYEKAANFCDPQAQRTIAYLYEMGFGVARDPVKAARWLERAVASGSLDAKVDLAFKYLRGIGVRKDVALALGWLKEAASRGHGRAASDLGDIYQFGIGVTSDIAIARHWYEVGVRRKDALAQYRLAALLTSDTADEPRSVRAAGLLRKAAAGGIVRAKYLLGVILSRKPELQTAPNEGMSVLEDAAKNGMWRASLLLASDAMRNGRSEPDSKRAFYWYQIANLQGGEEAIPATHEAIGALSKKLPPADRDEISDLAKNWFKEHSVAVQLVLSTHDNNGKPFYFALAQPETGLESGKIVMISPDSGAKSPH